MEDTSDRSRRGAILGPFTLEAPIGRGGMGEVWRGRHTRDGTPIAVKTITAELSHSAEFRARFREEVRAVARLDHPNVILLLDYGEAPVQAEQWTEGRLRAGSPYLVMELCSAGAIGRRARTWVWSELRALLRSLLGALAHAHARGVIHRDLKPANILMSGAADGRPGVKITDFGLAQTIEMATSSDAPERVAGTPGYMAPEQLEGRSRDVGPWTDLYALGCIAYELASGEAPFTAGSAVGLALAHRSAAPRRLEPARPVPAGFEAWLMRLLEKAPERRFVRAADAAWALEQMEDVPDGEAPAPEQQSGLADRWGAVRPPAPPTTVFFTEELTWSATGPGAPPLDPAPPCPASPPAIGPLPEAPPRTGWARPTGVGLGVYALRTLPLVGRLAEREALWGALREVHARREARLVLIAGAAGNGKTRLAEWLAQRAHEEGAATVLKAVHSERPGPAYGLTRMAMHHLRCEDLPHAEVLARVRRLLGAHGAWDPHEARALAELVAPSSSAEADPDGRVVFTEPSQRHAVLRRLLEHGARERPVIVWLDDVQWGEDSLVFAESVLAAQADAPAPVLFVLTAQAEALADQERAAERALLEGLLARPGCRRIALEPLPEPDHAVLVEELLGLSGELAARVEARTQGNPLFAVQLVGDWVQRGVLEMSETGFRLRAGEQADLPEDLRAVWAARLERALEGQPEAARCAIELAAALGEHVGAAEWAEACRRLGAAPEIVDRLFALRLARPLPGPRRKLGGLPDWAFEHGMLREAAERSAARAGRAAGHNAVLASVLEARAAAGEPGASERRARCLLAAGEPEAALAPLEAAAAESRDRGELRRCQELAVRYEEALAAAGVRASDRRWGEIRALRAGALVRAGALDAAQSIAERVQEEATTHGWPRVLAEAQWVAATARGQRGELLESRRLFEQALAGFELLEDPAGCARTLRGLAHVERLTGRRAEAEAHLQRCLRVAGSAGDETGAAWALQGLATIATADGRSEDAARLAGRALAGFERLGNAAVASVCLNTLAEAARHAGDLVTAERDYRRALALSDLHGVSVRFVVRINLALVLLRQDRLSEAAEVLGPCRRALEQRGMRTLLAGVHLGLLLCAAGAADWSAWDHHLEAARELLGATGFVDADAAWTAERAAEVARSRAEDERANAAAAIAADQRARLERSASAPEISPRARAPAPTAPGAGGSRAA